ncbi:hypothetical protein F4780DRAFT_795834 [Neofusicoccum parvum]|nr:hypothetical protein F4780DRAFT_795834 [Neofusicoccum parvum]
MSKEYGRTGLEPSPRKSSWPGDRLFPWINPRIPPRRYLRLVLKLIRIGSFRGHPIISPRSLPGPLRRANPGESALTNRKKNTDPTCNTNLRRNATSNLRKRIGTTAMRCKTLDHRVKSMAKPRTKEGLASSFRSRSKPAAGRTLSRGHLQDLGYTQPRAPPQISQNKVRMMKGQTYDQSDTQLVYDRTRCRVLLSRFNANGGAAVDERKKLAKGLLGSVGENVEIEAPFRCEYGYNIKIGDGTYISPDCIIEDPSIVSIGSKCFIGPRVSICCKKSSPNLNDHDGGKTLFYAPGIWIEDRVCIEAGVIIHAGVRIGRGSTIVAGSIVTKSIRERSLAGGNPAMTFQYL